MRVILFKAHLRGASSVLGNPSFQQHLVVALKGHPAHFQIVHCVPPSLERSSQCRHEHEPLSFKAIKETRQPRPVMSSLTVNIRPLQSQNTPTVILSSV